MPQLQKKVTAPAVRSRYFRRSRRLMATAVVIVGSLGVVPAAANAVTGVVDNTYVRTCSYITGRCTAYTQINGPHNSSVPNAYRTYWTFGVIL